MSPCVYLLQVLENIRQADAMDSPMVAYVDATASLWKDGWVLFLLGSSTLKRAGDDLQRNCKSRLVNEHGGPTVCSFMPFVFAFLSSESKEAIGMVYTAVDQLTTLCFGFPFQPRELVADMGEGIAAATTSFLPGTFPIDTLILSLIHG
eukprot:GHVU01050672.1.p2 GENE.GHVU01050672.1~~GHVU01050672.1.p2  ORF type:complete len:149 (+),score=15.92 GHVU01050672.1:295-741(+)